jgi:hypothetical protein
MDMSESTPAPLEKPIPENFETIIYDFTADLSTTFPEYQHLWQKWTMESFASYDSAKKEQELQFLYQYCVLFYPERFFDILYNNEDIFKEDAVKPVVFLPDIDFKLLFNCENVSGKTRKIMWNYLQLILMTVVGSVNSKEGFGNSTKQLFEGIDEKELFEKLNETMESMGSFFQSMAESGGADAGADADADVGADVGADADADDFDPSNPSSFFEKMKGMPNITDIYGHLKTLFDGKIGSLAKELTEEIAKDMGNIFGEEGSPQPSSTKDIIQNLLKNPEKMTGLIKTVSDKLNTKISSGEISQDELLKEATEIMDKMKGMGDSKQFQEMFKNISKMSGLGGKGKFDMNAFQQKTKQSSAREKLKEKIMKKKAAQLEQAIASASASLPPPAVLPNEVVPSNYKVTIGDGIDLNEVTPVQTANIKTQPKPNTNPKKKNKNKH